MKKNIKNETHIEGFVYEHTLELKVSGEKSKNPGTQFITGNLSIATDDNCVNIVPVHFTYVTATYAKSGTNNPNFTILKDIIEGKIGSIMKDGLENAGKVKIDSAIGLNEFYSDRSGQEELVSAKRNEGGFIHKVDNLAEDENTRNTFKCDMLITQVIEHEEDEEKGTKAYATIKGATFDFKNALLPVEFIVYNPNAINYFLNLGVTKKAPIFTKVWGRQISAVSKREIREESAFGDDDVREVTSTRKEWVITGAQKEPYVWDDEETITVAELNKLMADRETYLATIKQRQAEYKASQESSNSNGFNF